MAWKRMRTGWAYPVHTRAGEWLGPEDAIDHEQIRRSVALREKDDSARRFDLREMTAVGARHSRAHSRNSTSFRRQLFVESLKRERGPTRKTTPRPGLAQKRRRVARNGRPNQSKRARRIQRFAHRGSLHPGTHATRQQTSGHCELFPLQLGVRGRY